MSVAVAVDILGWLGALILIAAYLVVSYGEASGRSRVYQGLNVAGSALLVLNTAWHRAWPSSAVNVLWAAIGTGALIRATTLCAKTGGPPTEFHDSCGQKTSGRVEAIASFSGTTASNFLSHLVESRLIPVSHFSELFHPKRRENDLQNPDQPSSALPGFKNTPPPPRSLTDRLVSRTEQILINRAFQVVTTAMENQPLNEVIRPSGNLPGVSGQRVLTGGEFGRPGSRRIVFLTDGTTIEEQALEREQKDTEVRFRYFVSNYSTPKGGPLEYAIGEFRTSQVDASHTRIMDLLVQAQDLSISRALGQIWPLAISCQFC